MTRNQANKKIKKKDVVEFDPDMYTVQQTGPGEAKRRGNKKVYIIVKKIKSNMK